MPENPHAYYGSRFGKPTDRQCQSIGRVATAWSVLEHGLEQAIARLSFTPNYPSLAVTNDLGIDNRLKCLISLIGLHSSRYAFAFTKRETLERLKTVVRDARFFKKYRNMAIHYVWLRDTDAKMFGVRFKVSNPIPAKTPDESLWHTTPEKITILAEKIDQLSHELWTLVRILPETPEPSRKTHIPPNRRRSQTQDQS